MYHRYDFDKAASIWMIVHAPEAWKLGFSDLWHRSSHPLVSHLAFLRTAGANLRQYLDYMNGRLLDMVRA